MKLTAVHTIQRRDAKGRREVIAPRQAFDAGQEEGESLLKSGAAKKAAGAPEAEPTVAPAPTKDEGPADVELAEMTKAQLVQFAKDHEIEIDATANKAEVLDTIEAALRADDDLV